MIDPQVIDKILSTVNIVELVSQFVDLKKRGVNYIGRCPFHNEKTPSFSVSPSKNMCKCFSCGKGGNAIHFIMHHENMNFYEAAKFLAKKYGIEFEEREQTNEEKARQSLRESMFVVNEFAKDYYIKTLNTTPEGQAIGKSYFYERGFRDDIIQKFGLGYSLEERDTFSKAAIKGGYKKDYLVSTGLSLEYENGTLTDRFRGRVMFPVHTISGKVVAFGGRTLKKADKMAKYVNSPESEIYHKSRELYGIYFAKKSIVKEDLCYLVEGYTDVISMHQAGIENVVASSGTALTLGQIQSIRRFTENICVLYDGDAAGIKAALRGIDLFLEEGMNVKVVLLPDGEDPDSFAKGQSATSFSDFIKEHETDFIRFKATLLLKEAGNDPIRRAALITDIIHTIALIPDAIKRSVYIKETSEFLKIEEHMLITEVNKQVISLKDKEFNRNRIEQNRIAHFSSPQPIENRGSANEIMQQLPIESGPFPTEIIPHPAEGIIVPPPMPDISYTPPDAQVQNPVQIHRVMQYAANEAALIKVLVKFGEKDFCTIEGDNGKEQTINVCQYIYYQLSLDQIVLENPLFQQMLEEYYQAIEAGEKRKALNFFNAHIDPQVSMLSANLVSEKYTLSKYHAKLHKLEEEEDKLNETLPRLVLEYKDAIISNEYKKKIAEMRLPENCTPERTAILMNELADINQMKISLAKTLGERIILKR